MVTGLGLIGLVKAACAKVFVDALGQGGESPIPLGDLLVVALVARWRRAVPTQRGRRHFLAQRAGNGQQAWGKESTRSVWPKPSLNQTAA